MALIYDTAAPYDRPPQLHVEFEEQLGNVQDEPVSAFPELQN